LQVPTLTATSYFRFLRNSVLASPFRAEFEKESGTVTANTIFSETLPFYAQMACMKGNTEMVKLLMERGADPSAMGEGNTPFSTARISGHDHICDMLAMWMKEKQAADPKVWIRVRIAQLRREISNLEQKL
jgi:hypothetical protein